MSVGEAMTFRRGENLPLYDENITLAEMLNERAKIQRPPGAVLLTNATGKLTGIFTDGDLRRLITTDPAGAGSRKMADIMHRNPRRILASSLASEAIAIMRPLRIDELPVVDEEDHPVGLIDIQDLVMLKMLDIEPT
jgi:arabinose-5-phosphate isomerase